VRHASVHMRRRGMPTTEVRERRLLELADDHGLAGSVAQLTTKLLEWHGLFGLDAADLAPRVTVDLEARRPEDYAQGHGKNFEARCALRKRVRSLQSHCADACLSLSPPRCTATGSSRRALTQMTCRRLKQREQSSASAPPCASRLRSDTQLLSIHFAILGALVAISRAVTRTRRGGAPAGCAVPRADS
jgi:hypothetical protein